MLLLVSEEYLLFRPPQLPAPLSPPSGEGQPRRTLWEPSTENLKDRLEDSCFSFISDSSNAKNIMKEVKFGRVESRRRKTIEVFHR